MPIQLHAQNLDVQYPATESPVLRSVTFTAEPGCITAVVGPNGCGKTTVIRAAAGNLAPAGGAIRLSGHPQPPHSMPAGERAKIIAVVPQNPLVAETHTVESTVMMGRLPYHGWFRPESAEDDFAVREALEAVGLTDKAGAPLQRLSGGERQRVLIGRALAQQAPVLLLDEPTSHLDLRYQIEILDLLRRLARGSRHTILIAMHDLNLVARYADHVILLDRGEVAGAGSPVAVLNEPALSKLYSIPVDVLVHPVSGRPIVLPDGDRAAPAGQAAEAGSTVARR